MALAKTGYNENTSKSYIIDAATIFTNVTYDELTGFTGQLHGATSGGVTLTIEQTYRDIEIDGTSHTRVKGNKVLEMAVATVTANMKELTAKNIQHSLNGTLRQAAADEAPTGYQVIESKRYLEDSDYISNMAVVGTLSGTSDPVIAILDNVVSIGGLNLGTEDNNEAVVEQTYEAQASIEQLLADEYPWKILYPTVDGVVEG